MRTRLAVLLAFGVVVVFAADWNPRLAADYLDSRQKAWIAWPTAVHDGAPCISCHTNLTYLLARPALSSALHDQAEPSYRATLLDSLRHRLARKAAPGSQSLGTESVLAALLLASDDAAKGALTPETEQAFDRLWKLQIADGKNAGAWNWFNLDLEPWEEPESTFYGAALAALAIGTAPGGYAARPGIAANLDSLKSFLLAQQSAQPAHNRLVLAWASTKWPSLLTAAERKAIVDSVLTNKRPTAVGRWRAWVHGSRIRTRLRLAGRTLMPRGWPHTRCNWRECRGRMRQFAARSIGCARIRIRRLVRGLPVP